MLFVDVDADVYINDNCDVDNEIVANVVSCHGDCSPVQMVLRELVSRIRGIAPLERCRLHLLLVLSLA